MERSGFARAFFIACTSCRLQRPLRAGKQKARLRRKRVLAPPAKPEGLRWRAGPLI
jgi:hypothetical protein